MAKFFINRPIVAIVIAIITVIAGLVAMAKLPIAQLPDIVPPQISVSAVYTGADALTIEQSVATPLEQQMNGVDNMLYMMSTNANDGTMSLKVTYDIGTNVDIDQVNTQNRVSQASPNLPTSVNQYGVTVKKLMGLPLLVLSVYSPNGSYPSQFLGNYATININDALLRVPGVGQVTNFGAADYAMRIWVKPDQLTKLSLTVSDLMNSVQQQSAVNPAGQIGASLAQRDQAKISFEKLVTQAFGEVSTSLSAHEQLGKAYREQLTSVDAYRESVRLSTIRYDSGLSSYLDIIDAQIQMYPAESATVIYDLGRKLALVDLYHALGGGWNLSDLQWSSTTVAPAVTQTPSP
jgi:multidrug efflux pump subunit AcrB